MIPNNNHLTSTHVTDEQMYDLLDNPTLATSTHLHTCAACQSEFSALRASLDNFRTAATNLAAAEMPQLAARREAPTSAPRFGFRPFVFAASLATAAVLLVSSAAFIHPRHVNPAAPAASTTVTAELSDAELLNGIQQDLSASVPPSLAPLEVAPR